jgi:[methyl-Co(III) methanol-specific corrinoid protein]:coenzyme M methyltransferase
MSDNNTNHRERVLATLRGERVDPVPVFSGMGNLTVHGLADYGWRFPEVHLDGHKMAAAAASTYKLFGLESVVVPFDVGVEAEALGCGVNYYEDSEDILYPTISTKLADKVEEWDLQVPDNPLEQGRIPLVVEAIKELKDDVGAEVAVGAWVLGPYTLAGQILELDDLFKKSFKKPDAVNRVLHVLERFLITLARHYREAGADYMTVREMGGGGDVLSPRMFGSLIQPHLQNVFAALDSPKILHICGDTNLIIEQMADCGADAISVDQKNQLAETRKKLGGEVILLGNLDPYNILVTGTVEEIDSAVREIIGNDVNAVWPGCDIWPDVPKENMLALMDACYKYGKRQCA